MFRRIFCLTVPGLLLALCVSSGQAPRQDQPQIDPLLSWKDGPTKKAIVEFVRKITDKDGPDFVAAPDRIATFDNDGTLWVEQPLSFAFEDKAPKEKANPLPKELIGKWVVVGGEQDGATFDFAADGTMVGKINLKGREGIINAMVRVAGKKMFSTTKNPKTGKDDVRVLVIRTLNERELVLEAERGEVLKMERAK